MRDLGERQIDALTVAMIVAPGVYPRNRMFDLFTLPGARRARTRAALVRGLVPQLAHASDIRLSSESGMLVLRYAIAAVRLTRSISLSPTEAAALRLALERANVACLPVTTGDREVVNQTLTKLMDELELAGYPGGHASERPPSTCT